jgi:hypothetical protein
VAGSDVTAVTEDGREFPSWEALVESESNGYVVVAVISTAKETWPWVSGPYPTKADAERARARTRTRFKRKQQSHPGHEFRLFVRPAWKGDPR